MYTINVNLFVSITDAATSTGTPRSTLKKWCAGGHIEGAIKIGNQWALPSDWIAPQLKRGNPNFNTVPRASKRERKQKEQAK